MKSGVLQGTSVTIQAEAGERCWEVLGVAGWESSMRSMCLESEHKTLPTCFRDKQLPFSGLSNWTADRFFPSLSS